MYTYIIYCFIYSVDPGIRDSNMVSPEESVDGNAPHMEMSSVPHQATAVAYMDQHQMQSLHGSTGMVYNNASVQQPQLQNLGGMMYYQVPGTETTSTSLAKRRRLENGDFTNQGNNHNNNSFNMNNGQQMFTSTSQQQTYLGQQHQHQQQTDPKKTVPADRRRERNKILARRTRLRKKFFFESLQKEVMDLQRENEMLKEIVKVDIGGTAGKEILDSCDAVQRMPQGVLEACREGGMDFDTQDFNLVKSIEASQQSFIITDPSLTDNPIIFASDGFLEVTGYSREQVLGRNCRFLQGADTNMDTVEEMRRTLANGEDVSVTILNYTADGTPFWNKQFIAALRDAQNNIVNYIGVVVKVASPEPGHPDFGKIIVNGSMTANTDSQHDDDDEHNESTYTGGQAMAETALMALEDSVTAAVDAVANQSMS
jgi:PAS domain S-box-containing protein